jgi:integrase
MVWLFGTNRGPSPVYKSHGGADAAKNLIALAHLADERGWKLVSVLRVARARYDLETENRSQGLTVTADGNGTGRPLTQTITTFLADVELTKKPETHAAYRKALEYFQQSCAKPHLEDIEKRDLLKFAAYLRDTKRQSSRSVSNKFECVMSFLKAQGIRGLITKHDRPQYTEEEPEIYEQEDLDTLFGSCDAEEQLWLEFFLMTGMREQEVMHACWSDVNFVAQTVRVSHKPQFNWTPKAYKEREIPLPVKLAASRKAHKAKADKTCSLVFPTAGCKPKLDFRDCRKAAAKRSGLNSEDFWLHKFRATFATRCLWGGVDLRTVQAWLGHSDLESTMRYLKPARNAAVREKVNDHHQSH